MKYLQRFLIVALLATAAFGVKTYAAESGTTLGYVLNTDIRVFIDDVEIMGFNIDDWTYVIVEDLAAYGFVVRWDEVASTLSVTRGESRTSPRNIPANTAPPGSVAFPYLATNIVTYLDGNRVQSFNIGGQTVIRTTDLASSFGTEEWLGDVAQLRISLWPIPVEEFGISQQDVELLNAAVYIFQAINANIAEALAMMLFGDTSQSVSLLSDMVSSIDLALAVNFFDGALYAVDPHWTRALQALSEALETLITSATTDMSDIDMLHYSQRALDLIEEVFYHYERFWEVLTTFFSEEFGLSPERDASAFRALELWAILEFSATYSEHETRIHRIFVAYGFVEIPPRLVFVIEFDIQNDEGQWVASNIFVWQDGAGNFIRQHHAPFTIFFFIEEVSL